MLTTRASLEDALCAQASHAQQVFCHLQLVLMGLSMLCMSGFGLIFCLKMARDMQLLHQDHDREMSIVNKQLELARSEMAEETRMSSVLRAELEQERKMVHMHLCHEMRCASVTI